MNKKFLLLGTAVLLAVGAAWIGRAIYRAHYNLVTIDVYNAPLATVIKQMERQTREAILIGQGLEAKVTLAVKNMPLDEALNRLGQQTGAHWSKWHAVHGSERALNQLEAALRDRAKIEEAGWTNIAPQDFPGRFRASLGGDSGSSEDVQEIGGGATVITKAGKPVTIRLSPDEVKGGDVETVMREKLKAAGVDEATIGRAGSAMQQNTMDVDVQATGGSNATHKAGQSQQRVRMVSRSRGPDGEVTEEVWSPEHVVLEQRLQPKLGDQKYEDASEAVAREIAEKVKGDLTTLYVLRRSPGGFPFSNRMTRQIHGGPPGGTNSMTGTPPPLPDIESAVKRAEAENYVRLTPEQRVQLAREKKAAKAGR